MGKVEQLTGQKAYSAFLCGLAPLREKMSEVGDIAFCIKRSAFCPLAYYLQLLSNYRTSNISKRFIGGNKNFIAVIHIKLLQVKKNVMFVGHF